MALNPGSYHFIQPHAAKAQNYACQICRAPYEICGRCLTAKNLTAKSVVILTATPLVTARRRRPRAALAAQC